MILHDAVRESEDSEHMVCKICGQTTRGWSALCPGEPTRNYFVESILAQKSAQQASNHLPNE